SALGLRGRLRGDKKDGGSRGVGASSSASMISTDKSKITRKQSKVEQARTRESKEYKAEARKAKPQSLSSHNKPQGPILQFPKVIYNLKEIKRITSPNPPIGQSPSKKATSTMVKAQINVGFCAKGVHILIKRPQKDLK
ncbi:hypothetical protein Tco_0094190, partial [Tanacetum coccineum]